MEVAFLLSHLSRTRPNIADEPSPPSGSAITRSAVRACTIPRSQACLRRTGTGRPGRSAAVWTSMQRSRNVAVS